MIVTPEDNEEDAGAIIGTPNTATGLAHVLTGNTFNNVTINGVIAD